MALGRTQPYGKDRSRRGAATVELALVLPLLLLVFAVGIDFARAYYFTQLVTEASYKGAEFASNSDLSDQLPYASVKEAALADMTNSRPQPTVETTFETDSRLPAVAVTVTYEFRPICRHFGLSKPIEIRRTTCMRLHPSTDLPEGGDP